MYYFFISIIATCYLLIYYFFISIIATCYLLIYIYYFLISISSSLPLPPQIVRSVSAVLWGEEAPQYAPLDYTAPGILKAPPYADPQQGWVHMALGFFAVGHFAVGQSP